MSLRQGLSGTKSSLTTDLVVWPSEVFIRPAVNKHAKVKNSLKSKWPLKEGKRVYRPLSVNERPNWKIPSRRLYSGHYQISATFAQSVISTNWVKVTDISKWPLRVELIGLGSWWDYLAKSLDGAVTTLTMNKTIELIQNMLKILLPYFGTFVQYDSYEYCIFSIQINRY